MVGGDGPCLALRRDVGEQVGTRQVVDRLKDALEPPVAQAVGHPPAALRAVFQPHHALLQGEMPRLERRRPVGRVPAPGIGAVADADMRLIDQRRYRRERKVEIPRRPLQVARHAPPQTRQGGTEGRQLAVLDLGAPGLPVGVIAILLAARLVDAGRLQMPGLARADPHVPPGRRDAQAPDPREALFARHRAAVRVQVAEAPAAAPAPDAGLLVRDVDEPRRQRRPRLLGEIAGHGVSSRSGGQRKSRWQAGARSRSGLSFPFGSGGKTTRPPPRFP